MDKILDHLETAIKNSTTKSLIQFELLYYMLAKMMWKELFKLGYENCDGCITPHECLRHTCLFLWNDYQLKENEWTKKLIAMYYDRVFVHLNWSKLVAVCPNAYFTLNKQITKSCYWQTRSRHKILKDNIIGYIVATSVGEEKDYFITKLKLYDL